jgi:hypothetical protein
MFRRGHGLARVFFGRLTFRAMIAAKRAMIAVK